MLNNNTHTTYKSTLCKKYFAMSDIVCTFAAFKFPKRHKTVGKSSRPFLCPIFTNRQSNRVVVCGSSNARKDKFRSPEQHHSPYLFNVQKSETMNEQNRTAGETAKVNFYESTQQQRKDYMRQCLDETFCALMFYYDENCHIKAVATSEKGFEADILELFNAASFRVKQAIEETLLW